MAALSLLALDRFLTSTTSAVAEAIKDDRHLGVWFPVLGRGGAEPWLERAGG